MADEESESEVEEPPWATASKAIETRADDADWLTGHVERQIRDGANPGELVELLLREGYDQAQVDEAVRKAMLRDGHARSDRQLKQGLFWCVVGIMISYLGYTAADGGGSYLITWGVVLYGGWLVVRGVNRRPDGR